MSNKSASTKKTKEGETRRDFMVLTASAMTAVGAGSFIWPFVSSMNPAADTLALASTEVDLGAIAEGQSITVKWCGKPVFIRHRTAQEIADAEATDMAELPDPQTDDERIIDGNKQWLVMVGICTHLGCVPLGEAGDFGGWFCPCHGSHYDTAGRIRKGPAPTNMAIPEYAFLNDTRIKIG